MSFSDYYTSTDSSSSDDECMSLSEKIKQRKVSYIDKDGNWCPAKHIPAYQDKNGKWHLIPAPKKIIYVDYDPAEDEPDPKDIAFEKDTPDEWEKTKKFFEEYRKKTLEAHKKLRKPPTMPRIVELAKQNNIIMTYKDPITKKTKQKKKIFLIRELSQLGVDIYA